MEGGEGFVCCGADDALALGVFFGFGGKDILLIDDHGHSVLAMLGLGAVDPYWRGVVDHDGICWRCHGRSRYRHEARVETRCSSLVESDRLTGLGEG